MDYRVNGDMEVETTSIEINIMNYSTRLANYEISECAKYKHICFNFKKKIKAILSESEVNPI